MASQKALEELRSTILSAKQTLHCRKDGEDWTMELKATRPIAFGKDSVAKVWPVTIGMERTVDLRPLGKVQIVTLPVQAMASLTSLVAFKLSIGRESIAFALNLPVTGMAEERDRAILRSVIQKEGAHLGALVCVGRRHESALFLSGQVFAFSIKSEQFAAFYSPRPSRLGRQILLPAIRH